MAIRAPDGANKKDQLFENVLGIYYKSIPQSKNKSVEACLESWNATEADVGVILNW